MRFFLPAVLISALVHALIVAGLAIWPAPLKPAHEPSEDIAFTLVWDPSAGTSEPQEPAPALIPVLIEQPAPAPIPMPMPMPPSLGPSLVGPVVSVQVPTGSAPAGQGSVGGATTPGPRAGAIPGLESPRSVVFLLDHSISMGLNGTFRPARDELRALLSALPPTCLFQVIPYSRSAEPLVLRGSQSLTLAEPETIRHVLARLEGLVPAGSTEPFRAIKRGLQLRPDLLVLLTDRLELHDGAGDEITRLNQGRSQLHLIELVRSRQDDNAAATALAQRNRGIHRRILLP